MNCYKTEDSVTELTQLNDCEAKIVESSVIFDGTGKFEEYTGNATTKGVINMCTGENRFQTIGELCPDE